MKTRTKLIIGGIVVVFAAAVTWAYVAFNRPWWDERSELDRVFAGSHLTLTSDSHRSGSQLCFDDCPALTVGLTGTPETYAGFVTPALGALSTHGYTLPDVKIPDPAGGATTAQMQCVQDSTVPGPAMWECQVTGYNGNYSIVVTFKFSGDVVPAHVVSQGLAKIADSLPDDAPLVDAHVLITGSR